MEQKYNYKFFITCCDHTVSGECFNINSIQGKEILKTEVNFNESDLQRYYDSNNYISHSNHKQTLFDRIYFVARLFSLRQKLRLISRYKLSNSTLLDFGAGVGHFVRAASRYRWNAQGIEISPKARSTANTKSPGMVFPPEYLETLLPKSQSVITLWHVLEHLVDPGKELKKLIKLLHQDGRIIVAVPNYKSYDARYFGAFWAAYDVPRHLWHFSQKSISELFDRHDMEVESTHPMWLDAFYVSLLSTKYKYKSIKLFYGLWVGFLSNLKAVKSGEFSSLIYVIKHKKIDFQGF